MVPPEKHPPVSVDPQECIERAATRINALVAMSSLQLALSVASIVIEVLYDGDLERWRYRGPKERTLRQLAYEPSLSISASSLYRAMAIYELRVRMHDHPMWAALSVCHIRAVLGLPEHEQRRLLDLALDRHWSADALEAAVASIRAALKTSRGGRPRKPRFVRSIEHAERAMLDDERVFGDLEALYAMPSEKRKDLARRLSFVRQRCEELYALMQI